jgi:hypothetical protein
MPNRRFPPPWSIAAATARAVRVTKSNLKQRTRIELIPTSVSLDREDGYLRADYPAVVFQWSVRAGMAGSTGTRREATIPARSFVNSLTGNQWNLM